MAGNRLVLLNLRVRLPCALCGVPKKVVWLDVGVVGQASGQLNNWVDVEWPLCAAAVLLPVVVALYV